jgi:small subunit ribosomal protein S17
MADAGVRERGTRKERQGTVVSKSGNKTVVVLVERRKRHGQYGKVMKLFKKFHAHDENNTAKEGDHVLIVESRPLSRMKRWRVVKIIAASKAQEQVGNV